LPQPHRCVIAVADQRNDQRARRCRFFAAQPVTATHRPKPMPVLQDQISAVVCPATHPERSAWSAATPSLSCTLTETRAAAFSQRRAGPVMGGAACRPYRRRCWARAQLDIATV
jgi:hypothetical protein